MTAQVEDKPADQTNKVSDDDEDSTEAAFKIVAKKIAIGAFGEEKAKKKKEKTLLSKMHTHLFMLKTYISTLSTFIPQAVVASSRTTCKIRNQFKDIPVDINVKVYCLKFDLKFHVQTKLPAWILKYFLCH